MVQEIGKLADLKSVDQKTRLVKKEVWYDKNEPHTQIEIMKVVGLNGFLSKNGIVRFLKGKSGELTNDEKNQGVRKISVIDENRAKKLIDATVNKMFDQELIQPVKHEKEFGTKPSTFYSLTEKGIKILISNRFEDSKKNKELGINGQPYLNADETIIFNHSYLVNYLNVKTDSFVNDWKKPSLSITDLIKIQTNTNSNIILELDTSKFEIDYQKLNQEISEYRKKSQELEKLKEKIHANLNKIKIKD